MSKDEVKLVVVRCLNCNEGLSYKEGVSSHLRCPVCSGTKISFNKIVERICEHCGFTETIGIGEVVSSYHQSGHHDCILTIMSNLDEIDEEKKEELQIKKPIKKLRKKTKKIRRK